MINLDKMEKLTNYFGFRIHKILFQSVSNPAYKPRSHDQKICQIFDDCKTWNLMYINHLTNCFIAWMGFYWNLCDLQRYYQFWFSISVVVANLTIQTIVQTFKEILMHSPTGARRHRVGEVLFIWKINNNIRIISYVGRYSSETRLLWLK